ncbi:coiled-coil domain-containing protein 120 [Camarhynchus parvulus]|uniref:coiled-coil domain-containing protein 120 n=1 Tax=Geospiza parvula TaxID=87175 RepID=UPI001237DA4C|nr:coiled-coil domain-containing protein 120 [Camarhynchus parvulus]
MEVRGHILPPGTYSPAGVPSRLQELRERQRGLRQALGLRLRELRRLCLQEAELTGQLPPEYPLEPGERPQPPPRRRSGAPPREPPPEWPLYPDGGSRPPVCHRGTPTSCGSPHALVSRARREAQAQVQVQAQVLEAARRLAAVPGLPPEQRRRRSSRPRRRQRLRQLRAQLGTPGHDENGSLGDLPALENGAPPPPKPPPVGPGRPSPPRGGSGSPERRPLPPWSPEGPPGRRSSLATPASPARTLPRSASSLEGRSVPATPVLGRSPRGTPRERPEAPRGLPPRPWSGSQDSQLGGGPHSAHPPSHPAPPTPIPPPTSPAPPPAQPPAQQQLRGFDRLGGGGGSETPPTGLRGAGGGGGSPRCGWGGGPPCPPRRLLAGAAAQPEVAGAGGAARLVPAPHRDPPPQQQQRPQPRLGPPPRAAGTPPPAAPPPALPHSLSYAGALAARYGYGGGRGGPPW